jgi:hypothetical protein
MHKHTWWQRNKRDDGAEIDERKEGKLVKPGCELR